MKFHITILLLLTFKLCFSQTQLDSLINELKQADYRKISAAKDGIVNYQKEAIPKLMALLKETEVQKIKNTTDLIYPGTEKYYGHGGIVYYDIDWICVRAAWVLEEITFQNFGYRDTVLTEDMLFALQMKNYAEYQKNGYYDVDFKSKKPKSELKKYYLSLADSVTKWWDNNKNTWTRFNALKDALVSTDVIRQGLAIQYLRYGETICDGLTIENYTTELKPLVGKISVSKNKQSSRAQSLLNDKENHWFKTKQKKK
jgi:hypothetical protein